MYQTSYLSLESFISKEFWDSNFIEIMKFDPYPHKINKYLVKWFLNLKVQPKKWTAKWCPLLPFSAIELSKKFQRKMSKFTIITYLFYIYLSTYLCKNFAFIVLLFLHFLFFPNKCSSGLCQHTKGIYLFIFSASEFTLKYIQIYNTVYIMYNICTQKVLKR